MSRTKKRNQTTVESDDSAFALIEAYTSRRGATKKAVMSQLIRWFAFAPDSVKDVVQGWVPEDMRAEYAAQWRKWADTIESGVTFTPDGLGAAISTAGSGPAASGSTPKSPPKFSVPRRTPQPVRSGARDRLPDV